MAMSRSAVSHCSVLVAGLFAVCALAVIVLSADAQAALTHKYTGMSFGPAGTGAPDFEQVVGVTVRQSTGDVFVYDQASGGSVYKFDEKGEPVNFSSTGTNVITGVGAASPSENEIAVDDSIGPDSGDIYVANNSVVRIYSESGAFLGELTGGEMCGVAVGPTGDVYVGIYGKTVKKYKPLINPVTNEEETTYIRGLHGTCNVAVDSEGNLYAATYSGGITRYAASQFGSGEATGQTIDQGGRTLAVDPATNDLYADTGSGVEQYDASGSLTSVSGEEEILNSSGIGVKDNGVRLYVPSGAQSESRVRIYGENLPLPDVSNSKPEAGIETATLEGLVNPNGVDVTSCEFEYGTQEDPNYTGHVPCSSLPGAGNEPIQVSAAISGLTRNSSYRFRLLASNANGTSRAAPSTFTTLGPGLVEDRFERVGTEDATITARVQAKDQPTGVKVEYGTTNTYGLDTKEISAGANTETVQVTIALEGLQPETVYHARVIVNNASGSVRGSDLSFTTYPLAGLGLPDNRGYEKVSPNDNANGNVDPSSPWDASSEAFYSEQPILAAADGNALAYMADPSATGGGGHEGTNGGNQYIAKRLPGGGWTSVDVSPPSDNFFDVPVYQSFSNDLSVGFLSDRGERPLAAGAPAGGYSILYKKTFSTESYQSLITTKPPNRAPNQFGAADATTNSFFTYTPEPAYAGSSGDLKHVLYMANDALVPNAVDGGAEDDNLYDVHDGETTLVNILPDGKPEPNAMFGGPSLPPANREFNPPTLSHVISDDGSRIFWTGLSTSDLYLREGDTKTVQIDASVGGGGQFWTATPDGSEVLFTKGGDLYRYDVNSGQTTDLTPGGEVQGVVGASTDLSYIYFVANAVFAPGAKQGECNSSGENTVKCNLYVLHVGEPVKFIASLSGVDDGGGSSYQKNGDWQGDLGKKEAESTPDGTHLLFVSTAPLTGYENKDAQEMFLYDYGDGKLTCISCIPTGEQPIGKFGNSAHVPVSNQATYPSRWMSNDGNRAFFDSVDPLVPQDTNGFSDVYEWERNGSGSCAQGKGCIYLLSGGTSGEGSFLMEASASGDDVFFSTRARLVAEDENENADAYDARVGAPRAPSVPQCTGTGCQGVPSAPPIFSTPSSVTYTGVGNFSVSSPKVAKSKKSKSKKRRKKKAEKKKRATKQSVTASRRKSTGQRGRGK